MAEKIKVSLPAVAVAELAGAMMAVRAQETNLEAGTRAPVASLDLRCLRNLRIVGDDARAFGEKQGAFLEAHGARDSSNSLMPVFGQPGRFHVSVTDEAKTAAEELEAAAAEVVEYMLEPLDIQALDALGPLPRGVAQALEPLLAESA